MCKPLKEYLGVLREYKDTVVMFLGIAACVFVYADFRTVVKEQAETAAKTAEILRTMDARLFQLSIRHNRVFRSRPLSKRLAPE